MVFRSAILGINATKAAEVIIWDKIIMPDEKLGPILRIVPFEKGK